MIIRNVGNYTYHRYEWFHNPEDFSFNITTSQRANICSFSSSRSPAFIQDETKFAHKFTIAKAFVKKKVENVA
jgi:hypothetical protein